jgi:hypothetical protein
MLATDETNITEIELLPDGRICVFGTSLEVLDVLDELQGGADPQIHQRLKTMHGQTEISSVDRQPPALPGVPPMSPFEDQSAVSNALRKSGACRPVPAAWKKGASNG